MSPNTAILQRLLTCTRGRPRRSRRCDVEARSARSSRSAVSCSACRGRRRPPTGRSCFEVEAARARNERAAEERLRVIGRRIDKLGQGKLALKGYTPGGDAQPTARFFDAGA